ncbi:DUF6115 domain-containing protein [Shouchella lehensis]|uniref:Uncharacterized protein n=1 Tax=Shouchella lehensis TaxID=300825 RepID=A0A4Y7WQV6_9BACI|nr:hypothetical protein [Shouchella lehensis]MBG9784333.1 hypothetical protein [Shouchella lehensis]TES50674.1 hypothetical protein E2L03_01705 [Shouchella lehensis]
MDIWIILLVFAVIGLAIKITKLQQQLNQRLTKEELEEALATFLHDIKKDNEIVMDTFHQQINHSNEKPSTVVDFKTETSRPTKNKTASFNRDQVVDKVRTYQQNGKDPADIAKTLQIGIREVELIQHLNKQN